MIRIQRDIFLRSFRVISNQSFDLFVGSGASINSGIPTGNDLIWHFKREILKAKESLMGKDSLI
jgi:hypothetical protein